MIFSLNLSNNFFLFNPYHTTGPFSLLSEKTSLYVILIFSAITTFFELFVSKTLKNACQKANEIDTATLAKQPHNIPAVSFIASFIFNLLFTIALHLLGVYS